jgi:hypothetical protein
MEFSIMLAPSPTALVDDDLRLRKRKSPDFPPRAFSKTKVSNHATHEKYISTRAGAQAETSLSPSPVLPAHMSRAEIWREFHRQRAERAAQLRRAAERLRSGAPVLGVVS